jgi:hypothetical protein
MTTLITSQTGRVRALFLPCARYGAAAGEVVRPCLSAVALLQIGVAREGWVPASHLPSKG